MDQIEPRNTTVSTIRNTQVIAIEFPVSEGDETQTTSMNSPLSMAAPFFKPLLGRGAGSLWGGRPHCEHSQRHRG